MSDRYLFYIVATLIWTGVLFSFSLPLFLTQKIGVSQFYFFNKQALFAIAAFFIMWFLARLDPDKYLSKIGFSLFFFFFLLMFVMPFLPESVVPTINGARRWIRLNSLSLSPVEFFKVGFVFFLAWSLTRKLYRPKAERAGFTFARELGVIAPYVAIFLVAVILIAVMQNDLGQVVVLGSVMVLMILCAGASGAVFLSLVGLFASGAIALILLASHRIERVVAWWYGVQEFVLSLFPEFIAKHLRVEGAIASGSEQLNQSLQAFNHGGATGAGVGGGVIKLGFLNDAHNDFVLSGIAEEAGLFGVTMITMLILLLVYRILKIANRVPEDRPVFFLFSVGIGVMIAVQFLINALGSVGIIPIKGITAPFISYGGASLVALSIAIGLVLMVSKRARI